MMIASYVIIRYVILMLILVFYNCILAGHWLGTGMCVLSFVYETRMFPWPSACLVAVGGSLVLFTHESHVLPLSLFGFPNAPGGAKTCIYSNGHVSPCGAGPTS